MLKCYQLPARMLPVLLLCLACFPMLVFSQSEKVRQLETNIKKDSRVAKVIVDKNRLTPSLLVLNTPLPVADAEVMLQSVLQLRPGIDALLPFREMENKGSITVNKKQQFFKGIKVEHGKYSLLKASGVATAFMGEYYHLAANLNTVPNLSESQALNAAKQFVGAKEYAWEQVDRLRRQETDPNKISMLNRYYDEVFPKGELVIVEDFIGNTKQFDVAYKFNIYAADPLSRGDVYINAHTGKPMFYNKIIKHLSPDFNKRVSAPATIPEVASVMAMNNQQAAAAAYRFFETTASVITALPTRYAGTRLVGTKQISGNDPNSGNVLVASNPSEIYVPGAATYALIDDTKGGGFETYDLNGIGGLPVNVSAAYPQAKSFTDVNNNWTLSEHKRSNAAPCNEGDNDDIAFDAHWGATVVYDYWKKVHGRNSFDNANGSIKSYIHSGAAYDNAFWNGSVMTYGDGSFQGGAALGFMPLVSLDVCGHEIGHAICSYTSDLAYQNESGGMNEGFSDIWAACIEHFALDSIDATLESGTGVGKSVNGFKIWSIGEQIDANDATATGTPPFTDKPSSTAGSTALRYMDNPAGAGNPNYYYGTNWTEAINCTPTLANDQCGVHNNSGVLNRWFYLFVNGGTGNVQTDNIKNTTGALNGQAYNVTGVGFRKAERITYLMEQLLSQNATYLEARNMTMLAAETLFGKGSFEEKQAIVSWHGVAVGASADTAVFALLPPFAVNVLDSVNEVSAKSMLCTEAVKKIVLGTTLLYPGKPNAVSVTITPSGTATNGKDYTLQSTTLNYSASESGLKTDTITIINDGDIEGIETLVLQIHAQEALPGIFSKDTTITITISDDDAIPSISSIRTTLLSENFDAVTTGSLPSGWSSIDKGGSGLMSWKVGDGGGGSAFTTKSVMADENITPGVTPSYSPLNPNTIILKTPLINATGKADIHLKFSWAGDGEPDPGPPPHALDFGKVLYSFDGTNFQPFQFADKDYSLSPVATRDSIYLPPNFNNQQFYIGFQWFNDDNLAVGRSFHVDSVLVTAGARQVETELNEGVSETMYAGSDMYFLSGQDGEVLARVSNASLNLGCTAAEITAAGNGAAASTVTFNGTLYDRTNKVIRITPSTNGATATYNLTVYFTAAELAGFTANLSDLRLMKVKDGVTFSGIVSPSDAELIVPVVTDNSANGYYTISATGLTGFSQFAVVKQAGSLPLSLLGFNAEAVNNKYIRLQWQVAQESGMLHYVVERAAAGTNDFAAVGSIAAVNAAAAHSYELNDNTAKPNVPYQYRIKMVETGRSSYSAIRTAKLSSRQLFVGVSPNPSAGIFTLEISGVKGKAEIAIINAFGQEVYRKIESVDNYNQFPINLSGQAKGVYLVKVNTSDGVLVKKAVIE